MILAPLTSCCVFAAPGTGLLVYCGPEQHGCVHSGADPSPSAPGEVSSAGPSAVSGLNGALPAASYLHKQCCYDLFCLQKYKNCIENYFNITS